MQKLILKYVPGTGNYTNLAKHPCLASRVANWALLPNVHRPFSASMTDCISFADAAKGKSSTSVAHPTGYFKPFALSSLPKSQEWCQAFALVGDAKNFNT